MIRPSFRDMTRWRLFSNQQALASLRARKARGGALLAENRLLRRMLRELPERNTL